MEEDDNTRQDNLLLLINSYLTLTYFFFHSRYEDLNKYSTDQFVTAILVGTTPPAGNRAVSSERGLKMADSLGIEYIECASDDEVTVSAVVQRLIDAIMKAGLHRNSVTIEIKPRGIQSANSLHKSDSVQMECFC